MKPLSPWQVRHLGEFLTALSQLTREHQVFIDAYGAAEVRIGDDFVVRVSWDADAHEYVTDVMR